MTPLKNIKTHYLFMFVGTSPLQVVVSCGKRCILTVQKPSMSIIVDECHYSKQPVIAHEVVGGVIV